MKKKLDWQILLSEFLEQHAFTEFEWGKWDCCIFANAAIKAMSGKDVIPKTLKWKDETSAYKAIKDYGKTLNGALTKACKNAKMESIKPAFVTAGDLVLFKEESELAGIHDGFNIVAPSDGGIQTKSPDLIIKAWRIPSG